MADLTPKGFPYPEGPDAVDVAGDIQLLAEAVDDMPGVQSYTGTEISNLVSGEKWAGRIVWNSTSGKLQVSNGSTFSDVDTSLALASTNPAALGVAAVGNGTTAARDNHVHVMPSAGDVGAIATTALTASNPAALNTAAAPGSSTDVARLDHVHAFPTASDVSAIANSLVTAKGDLVAASASGTPAALAAGTNEHRLVADSAETTGLKYVADTTNYVVAAKGDLLVGTAADTVAAVTVGTNGHRLVADSGETAGVKWAADPTVLAVAVSDEITALTTGTAKITFRMPFAMTVTAVRASLTEASSSGDPTFDINEDGTTILSTKLSIDSTEKTSTTAATAAVISDSALADDAEITIDIDTAGTGAKGAKVYIIGTRA